MVMGSAVKTAERDALFCSVICTSFSLSGIEVSLRLAMRESERKALS